MLRYFHAIRQGSSFRTNSRILTGLILATACLSLGPGPRMSELEPAVRAILKDYQDAGAEVAVAYRDLATGEELFFSADVPFHAASTMKVPVMMEAFRQDEAGTLSLDDTITLKNEFASLVDGSKFALDPKDDSELTLYKHLGETRTLRALVRPMITESSNLATNLLVEKVSAAKTTEFMNALGAGGVKVLRGVEDSKAYAKGMNNEVTARGLLTLLSKLAERKVVSARASDEMLAILRDQKFKEGIPSGVPAGVVVAHKTGSFTGTYHDAGIVEPAPAPPGRKPFVLVVLTRKIPDEAKAHALVQRVARAAYEHALSR
jgi:beta-lactamase class A